MAAGSSVGHRGSTTATPTFELSDLSAAQSDGQIVPYGSVLPEGFMPKGPWIALSDWLSVSLPRKRFAAPLDAQVTLQLVRSTHPQTATILRTSILDWANYVATAFRARLQRLLFAASSKQVLVMGQPLPPIPGEQFYVCAGIATPVGFRWTPTLNAKVLSQMFHLENDDIAVLLPEGEYVIVRNDDWVGATRSAVHLTLEAIREIS